MTTRQINGKKYDVAELVNSAIEKASSKSLNLEIARRGLMYLGHEKPDDELVIQYARETAILDALARATGANFGNQIGKIDFSDTEKAIASVEKYLNRRIQGQRARWTANRK